MAQYTYIVHILFMVLNIQVENKLYIPNSLVRACIKGGVAGPNAIWRQIQKWTKKLGHNRTVTRAVLLPKTCLRTTTGRYIVKYTL